MWRSRISFESKRCANIEHFQKSAAENERTRGCSPESGHLWYDTLEMATPTMNGSALTAVETFPAEFREILHAAACAPELTLQQGPPLPTAEGPPLAARLSVPDHLLPKHLAA